MPARRQPLKGAPPPTLDGAKPRRRPSVPTGLRTSWEHMTPAVQAVVVDRLRHGSSWADAARQGGLHPRQLSAWRTEVERTADHPETSTLVDDVRTFIAECEAAAAAHRTQLAERIVTAGGTDWKADAWLLERQDPEAWGPPTQRRELHVTGTITHELDGKTASILAWALDLLNDGLVLPDGRRIEPEELLARFTLPAPIRALAAARAMAAEDPLVRQVLEAEGVLKELPPAPDDHNG